MNSEDYGQKEGFKYPSTAVFREMQPLLHLGKALSGFETLGALGILGCPHPIDIKCNGILVFLETNLGASLSFLEAPRLKFLSGSLIGDVKAPDVTFLIRAFKCQLNHQMNMPYQAFSPSIS